MVIEVGGMLVGLEEVIEVVLYQGVEVGVVMVLLEEEEEVQVMALLEEEGVLVLWQSEGISEGEVGFLEELQEEGLVVEEDKAEVVAGLMIVDTIVEIITRTVLILVRRRRFPASVGSLLLGGQCRRKGLIRGGSSIAAPSSRGISVVTSCGQRRLRTLVMEEEVVEVGEGVVGEVMKL